MTIEMTSSGLLIGINGRSQVGSGTGAPFGLSLSSTGGGVRVGGLGGKGVSVGVEVANTVAGGVSAGRVGARDGVTCGRLGVWIGD